VLKPFQDAFAADRALRVYSYITTRQNESITDREGVVCMSRGSGGEPEKRSSEGRVIDVTYGLRGREWVFRLAVEHDVKGRRS
jgi:hypothetical protein